MVPQRILVPVDYSPHAAVVLRHALALGRAVGASVHAVHVWECMPNAPAGLKVMTPGGPRPLTDLLQEEAERDMETFLQGIDAGGATLTHSIESGEPVKAILRAVQTGGHDLIVMGTHGRTGIQRLVLGSVAEKVLRMAPIPVMTVPLASTGA